MMGDDIAVTSEEVQGCTFRFKVDIEEGDEAVLRSRATRQRRVVGLALGQEVPRILKEKLSDENLILIMKDLPVNPVDFSICCYMFFFSLELIT